MSGRTDETIEAQAEKVAASAVAYALLKISKEIDGLTRQVKMLGMGDSYNKEGFGALEGLSMKITEAAILIADAIYPHE